MSDPQKTSSFIFSALLVSQIGLLAVCMVVQRSVPPIEGVSAGTLLIVGVIVTVSSLAASFVAGRAMFAAALALEDAAERVQSAMRAIILRMALLEAGSVTSLVMYLVTGEPVFIGMFVPVILMLALQRPKAGEWEAARRGR